MDYYQSLLQRASRGVSLAAAASRAWESGDDRAPVSDTAWEADRATLQVVEAVAGIDAALIHDTYPESRLGRLVVAARLLTLAGTDEGGESRDLEIAAKLLTMAAEP